MKIIFLQLEKVAVVILYQGVMAKDIMDLIERLAINGLLFSEVGLTRTRPLHSEWVCPMHEDKPIHCTTDGHSVCSNDIAIPY